MAILDPISEQIVFFGACGAGKSSLMLHFIDEYLKTQGAQRWELSEQIIREENAKRKTPLSFPDAPPVYTNIKGLKLKSCNGSDFTPIHREGKEIGINEDKDADKQKYKHIYPGSLIAIDEAHKGFCSKGNLPEGQRDFFNKRRHNRLIILLAVPRAVLINKDIRDTGTRFIEVCGQEHVRDIFKRISKTVWHCREFTEGGALEEYIQTDGKSGSFRCTTYIHDGNIFDLYNSFAFVGDFFPKDGDDFET